MTAEKKRELIYQTYGGMIQKLYLPQPVFTAPEQGAVIREPTIIIANHQKFADAPMIASSLQDTRIFFLIAEKLFKIPIFRTFLESMDSIRIRQNAPQTAWFKAASEKLREGNSVLIFPEGHVNADGVMTEFQPGFLMLAAATGAPILPVYIEARYIAFDEPTQLFFGAPIRLEKPAMNAQYIQEQTENVRQVMLALKAYADSNKTPKYYPTFEHETNREAEPECPITLNQT